MSTSLIDIGDWIDRFGDEAIRAESADPDGPAWRESRESAPGIDWIAFLGNVPLRRPARSAVSRSDRSHLVLND